MPPQASATISTRSGRPVIRPLRPDETPRRARDRTAPPQPVAILSGSGTQGSPLFLARESDTDEEAGSVRGGESDTDEGPGSVGGGDDDDILTVYDQVAEDLRSGRLTLFRQAATQATEDEPMLPGAISAAYDQVAEALRSGRPTLFGQAAAQATEDESMLPGAISREDLEMLLASDDEGLTLFGSGGETGNRPAGLDEHSADESMLPGAISREDLEMLLASDDEGLTLFGRGGETENRAADLDEHSATRQRTPVEMPVMSEDEVMSMFEGGGETGHSGADFDNNNATRHDIGSTILTEEEEFDEVASAAVTRRLAGRNEDVEQEEGAPVKYYVLTEILEEGCERAGTYFVKQCEGEGVPEGTLLLAAFLDKCVADGDEMGRILCRILSKAGEDDDEGSWMVATFNRAIRWRDIQELRRTGSPWDTVEYRELGPLEAVMEGEDGLNAATDEGSTLQGLPRGSLLFVIYILHTGVVGDHRIYLFSRARAAERSSLQGSRGTGTTSSVSQAASREPASASRSGNIQSDVDPDALRELDEWAGAQSALEYVRDVANAASWGHAYRVYSVVHAITEICTQNRWTKGAGTTGGFRKVVDWVLARLGNSVKMLGVQPKTIVNWRSQTYLRTAVAVRFLTNKQVRDAEEEKAFNTLSLWVSLHPRKLLQGEGLTREVVEAIDDNIKLLDVGRWLEAWGKKKRQ